MPPRVRLQPKHFRIANQQTPGYVCWQCRHASIATATTPAPSFEQTIQASTPLRRYPPTQPPSYKPPEFRKSQLHRQYQSLLRSTPLFLIFQHNNLKATEWSAIRRELADALHKVDEELGKDGRTDLVDGVGKEAKLIIVQTGIFASALRVTEFWDPNHADANGATAPIHGLSREAYQVTRRDRKLETGLEPLLSGPLALLTFPDVSPQHLKAALSILAPSPASPAPKRRAKPSYHEPSVQQGLQKLMLLGARVEGKVFDMEGTQRVGGIQGGLDGLRGQLVAMLSSVGAGLAGTLEAAGRSLYVTVEGRRGMLEEQDKEGKEGQE